MIPNYNNRQVETGGITASTVFGISAKDIVHIMSILRDTLYSDKILAALREYAANAWDAHREAGKPNLPIRVTLPTLMNPTLVIQDFGLGISPNDITEIYTQYGASTKRNSDNSVGMLGIGSKAGFAYSDSFTVTSCHGGFKRVYVAVLDANEAGDMHLLSEDPCGNETGVTINIPVKTEDISEFEIKAQNLFQYFNPRPDVNTELPELAAGQYQLKHGILDENDRRGGQWIAVMGCISYRINIDQLQFTSGGDDSYAHKLSGVLFFDIGEVQISASREELKYSSLTKDALKRKFDLFIEEYVINTIKIIEDSTQTMWNRRVRLQILHRLHLPVPDHYKEFVLAKIKFDKEKNKTFLITIGSSMGHAEEIAIHEETRFIIKDNDHPLTEYPSLSYRDYLIRDFLKTTHIHTELELFIANHGISGVPVVRLSDLPRVEPKKKPKKKVDVKHHSSDFALRTDTRTRFGYPWSGAWAVEKHVPTDSDVFVLLDSFQVTNYSFYAFYQKDYYLAEAFHITLPRIYGYKNTPRSPVNPNKCKGTEFLEWHKNFPKFLLTKVPSLQNWLDAFEWDSISNTSYNHKHKDSLKIVKEALGGKHPIFRMLKKQDKSKEILKKLTNPIRVCLNEISERLYKETVLSEAGLALKNIFTRYPLLGVTEKKLEVLWEEDKKSWTDYIQLVDRYLPFIDVTQEEDDDETTVHPNQ